MEKVKSYPPYPDPKHLRELNRIIDKWGDKIFFTMLREGITRKELISYVTRFCARKYLAELLSNPCPMRLISEIEDLAQFKRLCVHQQREADHIKYGRSDLDELPYRAWTQGLI